MTGVETSLLVNPALYTKSAVLLVFVATALGAHRARLDVATMYLAAMAGFGGALLGGGWYAALLVQNVAEPGGRATIGAFIGAAAFGTLVLRMRGGNFLRYADAAVPGIALGYAVYRVGCFLNGCCFGLPTDLPWGVTFGPGTEVFAFQVAQGLIASDAASTLPVHPTQLYHAALGLAGFLILRGWRSRYFGSRVVLACALYGAGRFAIEFFREGTRPVFGPLDANHLACLVMLLVALTLWSSRPVLGRQAG